MVFKPTFPVGIADPMQARNYLQMGPNEQGFVPYLVLIDRQGNIRYQHTGSERDFFSDDLAVQNKNLRSEIDVLLAERDKPAARPPARKSTRHN